MTETPSPPRAARRWLWLLLAFWAAACVWLLWRDWAAVRAMQFPDSDDDMRLLQVRDWLGGQSWFDLHQYRLQPPSGADIHWTRLVDLPLAAVNLLLRPLLGAAAAEHVAAVAIPLVTLLCAMALLAAIVRRCVAPEAWWWAPALLLMASPALGMMVPLRIDHHGWQIACLLAMVWGLIDPARRRGGLVAGFSLAASLTIGVEMLPYCALGLAAAALAWVQDAAERERLRWMAGSIILAATLALYLFIPPAARFGAHCDALSSAYLLPLQLGGAALLVITLLPAAGVGRRLGLAIGAGAIAAVPLLGATGLCLADPYHAVDPEARRLWLGIVAEALPLFRQTIDVALATLMLPLVGLAGAALMLRRTRGDAAATRAWLLLAVLSLASIALSLAQTRSAVTAQAMAVPGAAALGWLGLRRLRASESPLIRVFGSVGLFLAVSALLPHLLIALTLAPPSDPREEADAKASIGCGAPAAFAALDVLPAGTMLAGLDATPALVTHSHHQGLAGPYHRNGAAIVATMRAWTGSPEDALAIVRHYRIRYVALCGAPSEGDFYRKRGPHGFYATLADGRAPGWLEPAPVAGTPWHVWRVTDRALLPAG